MNNDESKVFGQNDDYLKFYELNDEGLRLYAQYKKAQHLKTLKFSLLGTALGFVLSNVMEVTLRRLSSTSLDVYKTFVFISVSGIITYNGYLASSIELKSKQRELVEKYGKEI
jgi:hypothetical protein